MRQIGRDCILVPEGLERVNFNKMIAFNPTAAFLWESIGDREFTPDDLVNSLLGEYEVEEEVARRDVEAIVKQWLELGIVIE